ncbi:CPBP family glutamic-type intramembrane protease [Marinobacter orientalis]|uniref:CPBP family intramembrane metalloprotease n=1 Tax=Marinobacter orientalis TaxID=1928859 RepID=A0A7Y0NK64_9GAMM|nr:CPBP family glutamic-type intramembrane protease [Marinobacter orientalis]NMT62679.1 CPBP family intramembrane metalloprotease [Marinobacter orientalis]TGX51366.1 CPBP family intramembrane metalloprotease [Marinobacter orientalis]
MTRYLRNNLGKSFCTSPFRAPLKAWALVPVLVVISVSAGFEAGLLEVELLDSKIAPLLPLILFVFPSLLEEAFFRGILIPRNTLKAGAARATGAVAISTVAFVAWHPINALAFNHTAIPLFLNPWFLVIVCALGITCGYSYVVSRSIWVPVIIHWVAVAVWVLFLGGRNLVLELQ